MPSPKKVAWAQLRVGVVALVAMIILAILVFLITGSTSFFVQKSVLYTYLSDSAAITNGATVRVNGILAGRVLEVGLSGSTEPRRQVKVTMEINDAMLKQLPDDSEAAIGAENVLGSKYINIKKGGSKVAPSFELTENPDILAAVARLPDRPYCVGFAAESHDLLKHAREKLQRKNVPLIVGNLGPATFGRDDNALVLVDAQGERELPQADKLTLARQLVADIASRIASHHT